MKPFFAEQFLTPEKFGEILCEDLELPSFKFIPLIAESIRAQVMDFESIHEVEIPDDGMRVVINVSRGVPRALASLIQKGLKYAT
jgi:SNF5 / SMARCB1 / INI1